MTIILLIARGKFVIHNKIFVNRIIIELLLILFIGVMLSSCKMRATGTKQAGYIVYNEPNTLFFVPSVVYPSSDYSRLYSDSFRTGFSFKPNCEISQVIEGIRADTLFDENPKLKDYAIFLKKIKIFPAEIIFCDTSEQSKDISKYKFLYNGKNIEFNYEKQRHIVINIRRL